MDSVDIEAVVIGAGVVGLACARRLSGAGLSTIVLDAESTFGQGASSRNSEVIHAGIYYKPGSLKAKLCIKGRDLLYEYCISRNINHSQIGKWIVANNIEQVVQLEEIAKVARLSRCHEIYWLSECYKQENKPELLAEKVLVFPRTGIVEPHNYTLSMLFQHFIINSPKDSGIKGLVNLFGIESPGLTSSLAIAEKIAEIFNLDN